MELETYLGKACKSGPHDEGGCIRYKSDACCVVRSKELAANRRREHPEIAKKLAARYDLTNGNRGYYIHAREFGWKRQHILSPDGSGYLTWKQYEDSWQLQERRCAICKREIRIDVKDEAVADHGHESNKFRGVLCRVCNRNLGWYETHVKAVRFLQTVGFGGAG